MLCDTREAEAYKQKTVHDQQTTNNATSHVTDTR